MGLRWKIAQLLEIRWWRWYLQYKSPETYLQWKKDYWRRFLEEAGVAVPAGSKVLDAGCGPAGIFMAIENCKIDAVDPLLGKYEQQLPHFRQHDYPQVSFKESALENYAGADAAYDLIFCLNAVNHVSDLGACLERLATMTKGEGLLILSVDAHRHSSLKWLFRALPGDVLHPQQYNAQEYKNMLERRGFRILRTAVLKREAIFDYCLFVAQKK